MKPKLKKSAKLLLSDKIADALTVKPKADIEDDQVFGTKPQTLTKTDLGSSDSEDETAISDFRKRNINLLSEVSKKYEGQVVSRKELKGDDSEDYEESDSEDEGNHVSGKDLTLHDADSDSSNDLDTEEPQLPQMSKQKLKASSDSEDFSSEGESDDYSITQFKKQIEGSDDDENEDEEEDDEESEGEDGEGYDISQMDEPMKESFEHVKKQNVSEEAKKGACVRNQLLIWEGLLEMRIHLQRCMNTANQMPMPDTYKELKQSNQFTEECNTAKTNIASVLDKFLTLQNVLFKNYPETKTIANKVEGKDTKSENPNKTKVDDDDEEIPSDTDNEEIPSDTEDEEDDTIKKDTTKKQTNITPTKKRKLEDYENDILRSHKAFKSFRDSTIQKWNEKTRLAAATNIKNKNAPTNTILQQISYILSDKEKLLKRTQLKRSEYDIIGYKRETTEEEKEQNGTDAPKVKDRKEDDEYIPEIFDDSDFYHQLLRELIECKSADISDPVQLSRQWIALQQMRSKMKRKVDTKATKGRKIKYVVHNQLVNYMAPEKCTTWNEESTNELYCSLFGKMFEHNNVGLNANLENGFKVKN
ncbi:protein AATF [Pectinophora gossypiella]|nr:protein AATF [Pectinophora gossypiella]